MIYFLKLATHGDVSKKYLLTLRAHLFYSVHADVCSFGIADLLDFILNLLSTGEAVGFIEVLRRRSVQNALLKNKQKKSIQIVLINLFYCSALLSMACLVANLINDVLIQSGAGWRRVVVLDGSEFFGYDSQNNISTSN